MRMELRGNEVRFYEVRFYEDVATDRCCGESRSDWKFVESCQLEHLVKSLERMVTGKSKIEFI